MNNELKKELGEMEKTIIGMIVETFPSIREDFNSVSKKIFRNFLKEDVPNSVKKVITLLNVAMIRDNGNPSPESIEAIKVELNRTLWYQACVEPSYPEIIDVRGKNCSAHLHVDDGIITEAENISTLFHANSDVGHVVMSEPRVAENINGFLEGITVSAAQALLTQLQMLPKMSNLNQVINEYELKANLRALFIRYVILKTLEVEDFNQSKECIEALANILDANFDSFYEKYKVLANVEDIYKR